MAGVTPALVNRDGGWQLVDQLEAIPDGWVAVFIPRAPPPYPATSSTCRKTASSP